MFNIFFEKIFPILSFFAIGYFLKYLKILKKEDAPILLKLVFYLFSPAVIILSVSEIQLEKSFIFYPLSALFIHLFMFIIGTILVRFIKLDKNEKKIFRGALLIMNMTFVLPFFIMFFGEENVYLLSMFDAGNLIMVSSLAYSLIVSNDEDTLLDKVKLLLKSPLIISIIIGICINIFNIHIPIGVKVTLEKIAGATGTVIMIALGMFFTPRFKKLKLSMIIIGVKIIGMLVIGWGLNYILPIDEMGKKLLLLGACSPVGNNVLTYVFISDGDMELATNIVSLSIMLSFFTISFVLMIS